MGMLINIKMINSNNKKGNSIRMMVQVLVVKKASNKEMLMMISNPVMNNKVPLMSNRVLVVLMIRPGMLANSSSNNQVM